MSVCKRETCLVAKTIAINIKMLFFALSVYLNQTKLLRNMFNSVVKQSYTQTNLTYCSQMRNVSFDWLWSI